MRPGVSGFLVEVCLNFLPQFFGPNPSAVSVPHKFALLLVLYSLSNGVEATERQIQRLINGYAFFNLLHGNMSSNLDVFPSFSTIKLDS